MTLGLFNPYDWDHILKAMQEGRWDAAKNLLIERDNRLDTAFDTFTYGPTLYQAGSAGQAITTTDTMFAQVLRVDRIVILQWSAKIVSVAGTATDPPIYISVPPQIAAAETVTGYVGTAQFETSVLGYYSGGVSLDANNSRLVTWPNDVPYTSPPDYSGDLKNMESVGIFCAWRLPVSKLSR